MLRYGLREKKMDSTDKNKNKSLGIQLDHSFVLIICVLALKLNKQETKLKKKRVRSNKVNFVLILLIHYFMYNQLFHTLCSTNAAFNF